MDYPFEDLGPERFQHFCQALIVREYPKAQCFPVGQPDGGRDAASTLAMESESGLLVFQIKFVRKPLPASEVHSWILQIAKEEFPKVQNLIRRGAREYCLVTNVQGTAHLDVGSIDRMNELLLSQFGLPSMCWWRADISRRLDGCWDLKWTYPELMTGPDLVRSIVESGLSEDSSRRSATLRSYIRDQFEIDQTVRFKQVELQNKLLELFIDVPIAPDHLSPKQARIYRTVAKSVTRQAQDSTEEDSEVIGVAPEIGHFGESSPGPRPRVGAATLLLHPLSQQRMNRIVLEGAPGQGKSTLVQYMCQVHRMRILNKATDLDAIPNDHKTGAVRIPFKVDLRDLSTWLNKKDPFSPDEVATVPKQWFRSLEAFLAAQIRHHSGGADFSQDDLLAVAKISALLIVFDGLDEVAEISRRQEVVDEIQKGINRLEEHAASLQVIVTSRPTAFANSPGLPEDRFPYFQLDSVTRPLIEDYANKWLKARRVDSRQSSEFKKILRDKLDQPHLRDLARNPMQLAILLSLIHTRGSSLPDKRTALYDSYMELFFNRESEKSDIVREYRDLLIDVHRYLAWLLHSEAEEGHDRGSISSERLQSVVSDYLKREGHDPSLSHKLFRGMVERVVALVSRVQGTYEFEVQPLREYFAARYLYDTAPYSPAGNERKGTKPDRFDGIARDFYWFNVTRFYAGCFSKGELSSLVDRLQELVNDKDFRNTSHPRVLAATLLSDWVFTQHPRSLREVVRLLLDGIGLRFVLTSESRRIAPASPLLLPPKCGRDELLDRCFEILTHRPARDYAIEVISVIKANSAPDDVERLWLRGIGRAGSQEDRLRWLEYGYFLEVVPRVDAAKLGEVLTTVGMEEKALTILYRARRFDLIEKDHAYCTELVAMVLDREISFRLRTESIFEVLGSSLDARRYAVSFGHRRSVPLKEIWENRRVGSFGPLTRDSHALSCDEAEKCRKIAEVANSASEKTAEEWASKLGPWNEVVEKARELWGERWVLYHMANIASGIRSPRETGAECPDLWDSSRPLCSRARYARLRAGVPGWWRKQFSGSRNEYENAFAILVLMTWGSERTLVDLSEEIGRIVDTLSPRSWRMLASSLRSALATLGEISDQNAHLSLGDTAPGRLTNRVATLFGIRADEVQARIIFGKYLTSYSGNDSTILDFCQKQAFALSRATQEWNANLKLIQRSYLQGVISEPFARHQFGRRAVYQNPVPLPVAQEIAGSADKYPASLVGLAEARCRADVASKIVPVGTIAKKEGWFST